MRNPLAILIVLSAVAVPSGSLLAATPAGPPTMSHCLVSLINEAQVPSQEAGVMADLKVHEGQTVAKGDVLAQIDDALPQADKRKAIAEQLASKEKATSDVDIRYAKAAAEVAYFEYLRNKQAADKVPGSVVEVELKRLELAYHRAKLQIEQAELEQRLARLTVDTKAAEVDVTEEAIRHRQIKAPLDGVVVQVNPHVGEWVKPGDMVLRIEKMDRLRVEGFLNSSQYSPHSIRDRPVTVTVELAGYPEPVQFTGRIVFVSPMDEAGGVYLVRAEVDNRLVRGRTDEWLLRPGASVTMNIELN
jgi:RND family efflux transporter MFP subunit